MTYTIFSIRPVTEKVGQIKTNGEIYATSGVFMGSVSADGRIRTSAGLLLGTIAGNGRISSDVLDFNAFKVSRKGHILKGNITIGAVKQIDKGIQEKYACWASCALFFYNNELLPAKKKEERKQAKETVLAQPPAPAAIPPRQQFASHIAAARLTEVNMPPAPPEPNKADLHFGLSNSQPNKNPDSQTIENSKESNQTEVKTARRPMVQTLENFAGFRKKALFARKRKNKGI